MSVRTTQTGERGDYSGENVSGKSGEAWHTQQVGDPKDTRIGIEATGGSTAVLNTGGNRYRVHTFDATSTLNVSSVGGSLYPSDITYFCIGGGGGGGNGTGGGGGAGGYVTNLPGNPYAPVGVTATMTVGNHVITVGAGGAGANSPYDGVHGTHSKIGSSATTEFIVASGGGRGRGHSGSFPPGGYGGSGGGGGRGGSPYQGITPGEDTGSRWTPDAPAYTAPDNDPIGYKQGEDGGNGGANNAGSPATHCGGGGGGAGEVGGNGARPDNGSTAAGGSGGSGLNMEITGSPVLYGGGGGGSASNAPHSSGGTAGGGGPGGGGSGDGGATPGGSAGSTNLGAGGGGRALYEQAWAGGSGKVIIRYLIAPSQSQAKPLNI